MSNPINIGLMGLGTVGSGVWELLEGNNSEVGAAKFLQIKKVLIQDITKNREVDVGREVLTTDPRELIEDRELDIIVELIGGITPARDYIMQAFQESKDVVTANKNLIARYGDKLLQKADEHNVNLLFSASAGGGIPVISALEDKLAGDNIRQISGILNGTTNYILTRMKEGLEFAQALEQAQELGYAESDPNGDISGQDSAYKLAILSSLAFGLWIDWQKIQVQGITDISSLDIKVADKLGYSCKLLCQADKTGGNLSLSVQPAMIPKNQALAGIENEENAIQIKGEYTGDVFLAGPGAGSLPTAGSVISDIIKIVECAGDRYKSVNFFAGGGPKSLNLLAGGRQKPVNPGQQQKIYKKTAGSDVSVEDNDLDRSICFSCSDYYLRISAEGREFSRQNLEEFIRQQQLEIKLFKDDFIKDDFEQKDFFVLIARTVGRGEAKKFCEKIRQNENLTLESVYPVRRENKED